MNLSQSDMKALLDYDPDTGLLSWRERPREMFSSDGQHSGWNKKYAGKPALNSYSKGVARVGSIFGKMFLAHRVIWFLVHGVWPDTIDHINGDPSDNRLINLRNVTQADNARNMKRSKLNKSGITGVRQEPSGNWSAHIGEGGKSRRIGTFPTIEMAAQARAQAAVHFHQNHGKRL